MPVPKVETLEELNAYVMERCIADGARTVSGQKQTIDEAFESERPVLLALPAAPIDTGVRKSACSVDSYQTVMFDGNRYSVATKYIGKPLWFRAYWDRIQIGTGSEIVAEHRSYDEGEYVLSPEHYFDLLERRPQAVGYARPLLQAEWPEEYWQCYAEMSANLGSSRGGRDFVRILRCNGQYGQQLTLQAISEARSTGALNADVVIQILDRSRCSTISVEPLDISDRPELAAINVSLVETSQYQELLGGERDEQHVA